MELPQPGARALAWKGVTVSAEKIKAAAAVWSTRDPAKWEFTHLHNYVAQFLFHLLLGAAEALPQLVTYAAALQK